MLKHRLFFGAILIAVLLGLIWTDNRISMATEDGAPAFLRSVRLYHCDGIIITAILAVVVLLGTWELHRLLGGAGHAPLLLWPALVNVVLVGLPFLAGNQALYDVAMERAADHLLTVVMMTVALIVTAFLVACRRQTRGAIGAISTTLLTIFYLGLLSQFIVRLRLSEPEAGAWLVLYFLATVKICDIGAYFTGRAIGKHKLIEWLSPKKTWEGLLGGVTASILVAVFVPILVTRFAGADSVMHDVLPGSGSACLFGLVMALAGQAGDLLESLIKRDAAAKDSASAIPAFGGVLDILDSPLLAAPFAYWMLVQ